SLIGVLNGAAMLTSDAGNIKGTPDAPVDARLGPLRANGGPTATHALLTGSPAIDAGSNALAFGLITDQRGFRRVVNGRVGVGAAELREDGVAEIVAGDGPGGAPHVKVVRCGAQTEVASFFAFDSAFRGGVSVAGDAGFLVAGAGPGGGPQVRVFTADS